MKVPETLTRLFARKVFVSSLPTLIAREEFKSGSSNPESSPCIKAIPRPVVTTNLTYNNGDGFDLKTKNELSKYEKVITRKTVSVLAATLAMLNTW